MIEGISAIWKILNSPDNDPVVIGLLLGWSALLVAQTIMFFSYRRLLNSKDRHLEDIIEQRNLFQEVVLKGQGLKRLTTKKKNRKKT